MNQLALTPDELARYSRQIGPGVLTLEGQQRLKAATALVSRAGGMGGPAALALVTAGIGRLILAHGGSMISADLNRQILGSERVIGQPRAPCFAEYLRSMNRFVTIESVDHEPNDLEALELARRSNIVLSCAPTFAERLRLHDAAIKAGVPFIDAAQWGMTGTLVAVDPGRTACLRCLYPADPEFEEMFPVVGAISMATGAMAALEAIKIIAQTGSPLFGRMAIYDGYRGQFREIQLQRDPKCCCCGQGDN